MSHCGSHDHSDIKDGKRLLLAFVVIVSFMVVEAVGGVLSGSLALLADAAHMFTDATALALAAGAQWFAVRPADKRLHFGYRRIQVLAAFVNGIALTILLGWIFFEAVQRLFFEAVAVDWGLMLVIAILGFLVNAAAFRILHASKDNNLNVRAAMLHVVSDLIGSGAAIVAALVIAATGWVRIDPILSMLVAVLIGRSAWRLLKDAAHILLEGAPNDIDMGKLVKGLRLAAPEVEDIHNLHIWQITPEEPRLTMHARIASAEAAQPALEKIKTYLGEQHGIQRSTIQIEIACPCVDINAYDASMDYLQRDPELRAYAAHSNQYGANPPPNALVGAHK